MNTIAANAAAAEPAKTALRTSLMIDPLVIQN
jgi:hypothetical protein